MDGREPDPADEVIGATAFEVGVRLADVEAELEKLATPGRGLVRSLAPLLLTVAAFIGLGLFAESVAGILTIVVVLFIHEFGHTVGMRWFGYRDVRMIFIPLLGAAASGTDANPSGEKRAVVALLGPVPGIAIGVGFGIAYLMTGRAVLREITRTFIYLNFFNLLPFHPLDGARLLEHCLFTRNPRLEIGYKLGTGGALLWIAWKLQAVILGIFAALILLSLLATNTAAKVAAQLRRAIVPDERLSAERVPRGHLAEIVRRLVRDAPARKKSPKALAVLARDVWSRVCTRPPSVPATVALVGTYVWAAGITMLCAIAFEGLTAPSKTGAVQHVPRPQAVPFLAGCLAALLVPVAATVLLIGLSRPRARQQTLPPDAHA